MARRKQNPPKETQVAEEQKQEQEQQDAAPETPPEPRPFATLTLKKVAEQPKSSVKAKETVYEVDGIGKLYVRNSFFTKGVEPVDELVLTVPTPPETALFSEPGEHPRVGGGKAGTGKKKIQTQEQLEAEQRRMAKAEKRLARMRANIERAKKEGVKPKDPEDKPQGGENAEQSDNMDNVLES